MPASAAFVDESYEVETGFYWMAAVHLTDDAEMLEQERDRLRSLLRRGQSRLRWSKVRTSAARIRLLTNVQSADHVVHATRTPCVNSAQVEGRRRCLLKLLELACPLDTTTFVLDQLGGEAAERRDRQSFLDARRIGTCPQPLDYRHESSKAEPLLWLPDLYVGALRAGMSSMRPIEVFEC